MVQDGAAAWGGHYRRNAAQAHTPAGAPRSLAPAAKAGSEALFVADVGHGALVRVAIGRREGVLASSHDVFRTDRELAAVYVPTTPNPTSGYLEIVPVELLTPTDWTVDQAMSFIISGGAVAPSSVPFTRAGERTGERTE